MSHQVVSEMLMSQLAQIKESIDLHPFSVGFTRALPLWEL